MLLFSPPAWPGAVVAGHPVYDFLSEQQLKGRLLEWDLTTQPMGRESVAEALERLTATEKVLRPWERAALRRFREELAPSAFKHKSLSWSDERAWLLPGVTYYTGGRLMDSLPRYQGFLFGSLNASVEGRAAEVLDFQAEAAIAMERSRIARFREHYTPTSGLPYNVQEGKTDTGLARSEPQKVSTFDGFRSVLGHESQGLRLEAAYDWLQWGPGIWQHPGLGRFPWFWVQDSLEPSPELDFEGSLGSSYRRGFRYPGESAPMLQGRLDYQWRFLRYVKFFSQRTGVRHDSTAYLSGHRLVVLPHPRWRLAVYELVAYARRDFEPLYALPLVPLVFAEHQLGDRDNILLGLELSHILPGRGRLYADLLLDDLLSPFALFRDWWGNKFALTLGVEWLAGPDGRLQLEYARIEPWFFGHHLPDNQLQHFGALTGSSLPPNSRSLRGRYCHRLMTSIEMAVEYKYLQRQPQARGSSIFHVHDENLDGLGKNFLGDHPETRHGVMLEWKQYWGSVFTGELGLGWLAVENWNGKPGESLQSPVLQGGVLLRY